MGFGNIGIWQLLIILLIVVVIFGTKRLRNMGGDVGGAVKNFREAMNDKDKDKDKEGAPGTLNDQSATGTEHGDPQSTARTDKNSAD